MRLGACGAVGRRAGRGSHPFLQPLLRRAVGANCATANHQRNETLSALLSSTAAPNQGRDQRETLGWLERGLVSKGPESRANHGRPLAWPLTLLGGVCGRRVGEVWAKPGASPLASWLGLAGSNSKPMRVRAGNQNRFRTRIVRHIHRVRRCCDKMAHSPTEPRQQTKKELRC